MAKRPNTTGDGAAEGLDEDEEGAGTNARRPKTTGVIKGRRGGGGGGGEDGDMGAEGLGEVELALQVSCQLNQHLNGNRR